MLDTVQSPNELMFLLMIYSHVIDTYSEKKREKIISLSPVEESYVQTQPKNKLLREITESAPAVLP